MGTLHKQWTDAKKKVTGIDSLFKEGLGAALDKAEATYADFKKYESDLPKMVRNVDKVKEECDKAIAQVKEYKTLIANTKAKPSKTKAISLFMDREKALLTGPLNGFVTTLNGWKSEAGAKKMPTPDEMKSFRAGATKSALKTAGL